MAFILDLVRVFIGISISGGILSICLYAALTGKFPEVRLTQHKLFEEIPAKVVYLPPEPILTTPKSSNPNEAPVEKSPVDAIVGAIGNMHALFGKGED